MIAILSVLLGFALFLLAAVIAVAAWVVNAIRRGL
jgi:hypothetical protein